MLFRTKPLYGCDHKTSKQFFFIKTMLYNVSTSTDYTSRNGEMAEWLKAPVLKTGIR